MSENAGYSLMTIKIVEDMAVGHGYHYEASEGEFPGVIISCHEEGRENESFTFGLDGARRLRDALDVLIKFQEGKGETS